MKIIQVPMEESEASHLAEIARAMKISRADLIRRACAKYLAERRQEELDRQYELGYQAIPEKSVVADASASLAGEVLPAEDWS